MSKVAFLYHKNCFDGFTAAWVHRMYVDGARPNATDYYPCAYGEFFPEEVMDGVMAGLYNKIIIADFTFPRDVITGLLDENAVVEVYDHHKTAEKDLAGLVSTTNLRLVFDMKRSGAGIVWDELVSSREFQHRYKSERSQAEKLVTRVEDRDIWRMSDPLTPALNAIMSATPMTFEDWSKLAALSDPEILIQGEGIQKYIQQYGLKAAEHALPHTLRYFDGDKWHEEPTLVINSQYMNVSEHLNALLLKNNVRVAVSYYRGKDFQTYVSFRSTAPFDCSVIARFHGGGGHAQASGAQVDNIFEVIGFRAHA